MIFVTLELRFLARAAACCRCWHNLSISRLRAPDWTRGGGTSAGRFVACARSVALDEDDTLVAAKADGDERVDGMGVTGAGRGAWCHHLLGQPSTAGSS